MHEKLIRRKLSDLLAMADSILCGLLTNKCVFEDNLIVISKRFGAQILIVSV